MTHSAPGGWLVGSVLLWEGGGVKHNTQDGGWLVTRDQVPKRLSQHTHTHTHLYIHIVHDYEHCVFVLYSYSRNLASPLHTQVVARVL